MPIHQVLVDFQQRGMERVEAAFKGLDAWSKRLGQAQQRAGGALERGPMGLRSTGVERNNQAGAVGRRERFTLDNRLGAGLKQLEEWTRKQAKALQGVTAAFEKAKVGVMNYARAGLGGTTVGELLSIQFTFLSREITQLFLPAIMKVSDIIKKVTGWFRSLSGEQQENIGKWTLIGTAMLGVLTLGPKLGRMLLFLGNALKSMMVLNPFLLIAAGVGGLMASTEEGRESLTRLGESILGVFGKVAEMLAATILPIIEGLADALSSTAGQWLLMGSVAALVLPKIIFGIKALALSFLTLKGAMFGALGLLAMLFLFLGKTEFHKQLENIATQVRKGKKSIEEARQEMRDAAEEEAERQREKMEGTPFFKLFKQLDRQGDVLATPEEIAEKIRQGMIEEGEEKIRKAAEKQKARNELSSARTGFEDPRETLKRLQQAALKTDWDKKTAQESEETNRLLKEQNKVMGDVVRIALGDWNKKKEPTAERVVVAP